MIESIIACDFWVDNDKKINERIVEQVKVNNANEGNYHTHSSVTVMVDGLQIDVVVVVVVVAVSYFFCWPQI